MNSIAAEFVGLAEEALGAVGRSRDEFAAYDALAEAAEHLFRVAAQMPDNSEESAFFALRAAQAEKGSCLDLTLEACRALADLLLLDLAYGIDPASMTDEEVRQAYK